MTTRSTSSDSGNPPPSTPDGPGRRPRLITLDGMPGAGKTTLIAALAALGHQVLGEYTATDVSIPETVPLAEHPAVHDDDAHQANWIRKAAQTAHALETTGRPVFTDRDWLSSLAYAYSIADTDHGRLLRQRAAWARANLAAGRLLRADTYLVFHLSVTLSLRRRAGALPAAHPWSHPKALRRLQTFYQAPTQIIGHLDPTLAAQLRHAFWRSLPGTASTSHALDYVLGQAQPEHEGRTR